MGHLSVQITFGIIRRVAGLSWLPSDPSPCLNTSKLLILLMHRGKRKMHEVLSYMQSDPVSSSHHLCEHSPCYLCLLTTRCELLLNPIQLDAQHLAHLALTLKHLGCNFYSNTIQNDTSFLSTSSSGPLNILPIIQSFYFPLSSLLKISVLLFPYGVSTWCPNTPGDKILLISYKCFNFYHFLKSEFNHFKFQKHTLLYKL